MSDAESKRANIAPSHEEGGYASDQGEGIVSTPIAPLLSRSPSPSPRGARFDKKKIPSPLRLNKEE